MNTETISNSTDVVLAWLLMLNILI